jgi:hypothetical protein
MSYSKEIANLNAIKSTLPRGKDGRFLYTNEFRARALKLTEFASDAQITRDLSLSAGCFTNWKTGKKLHAFKPSKAVAMQRKKPRDDSPIAILERQRTELAAKMVKIEQAIQLLRELGV